MKYLSEHLKELDGKDVILRASLNEPLSSNGKLLSDFRLESALPTILALSKRVNSLHIIAHAGDSSQSLKPMYKWLKKRIWKLQFVEPQDYFKEKSSGIYLYENLRFFEGEKACDPEFAAKLAKGKDAFVQDAFAVLHREHASVVLLPKILPSFAGFLVEDEIKHLQAALSPQKPSCFVLGGAKISSKEPLLHKMLNIYDKVFIAGALANEALFAKGFSVGQSKIDDGKVSEEILEHPNLILPNRYTMLENGKLRKSDGTDIKANEVIVDAFPSLSLLQGVSFLLWNGPLGWYERGFEQGSAALLGQMEIFAPRAYLGGGDTNAIVESLHKEELFAFRSTGGGAMLKFLESESLPGVEVLG